MCVCGSPLASVVRWTVRFSDFLTASASERGGGGETSLPGGLGVCVKPRLCLCLVVSTCSANTDYYHDNGRLWPIMIHFCMLSILLGHWDCSSYCV